MKHLLHQSRIQYLIERRNGYLLLAGFSIVLNMILGFVIVNVIGYQKIILVPPVIERPLWVTAYHVSPEYLQEMSLYFTHLLLNVTPSNISRQHQIFLNHVDSSYYGRFKTELVAQAERLKKEHITMNFQLIDISADPAQLAARIVVDVYYTVGNMTMPTKRLAYVFKFNYQSGQLKVKSFEEVPVHA